MISGVQSESDYCGVNSLLLSCSVILLVQNSDPCNSATIFVFFVVGCMAQWYNVGLWSANFSCPVLDLQLMGDHYCG